MTTNMPATPYRGEQETVDYNTKKSKRPPTAVFFASQDADLPLFFSTAVSAPGQPAGTMSQMTQQHGQLRS